MSYSPKPRSHVRILIYRKWPIVIDKQETKLLQYADDTTAVLSDTESAYNLFQLLDKFKKVSGLKVNSSKTEGLWIGSLKGSEMKPLGIKWPQDPIKALGIFFSYDKKMLYLKNFTEKLDKIKKLINIWSSRGLHSQKFRTTWLPPWPQACAENTKQIKYGGRT